MDTHRDHPRGHQPIHMSLKLHNPFGYRLVQLCDLQYRNNMDPRCGYDRGRRRIHNRLHRLLNPCSLQQESCLHLHQLNRQLPSSNRP